MTATQKLQQIKNWLFSFEKNHKFTKYKCADQSEYEIDGDIAVGKEVYKVMEDGTTQMMQEGKFQIDGKVLDVKDGVIKDIISGNRIVGDKINNEIKKEEMSENQKFISDALLDDTQVSISGDAIKAGEILKIVKDGEELLPPAGEHELKSGVKVVVDDAGKIIEVKPVEPKAEAPEVEKEVEIEAASQSPVDEQKDSSSNDVKEMMKQIMEAVSEMKQKMSDMEKKQTKMGEEFKAFKKEPAAEPLKRNENAFAFNSNSNSRVELIEALRGRMF